MVMKNSNLKLAINTKEFLSCPLFFLFILLVACPISGQAYNRVKDIQDLIAIRTSPKRILFEIDENILEQDMLFLLNGITFKHIQWIKEGSNILLIEPVITSSSGAIIVPGNKKKMEPKIIGVYPITDMTSKEKHIIDVTSFFRNEIQTISNLSTVKYTYSDNELLIRFKNSTTANSQMGLLKTYYFSFSLLPKPMKSRLHDHRMGYAIENAYDPINHFHKPAKANISRWRLVKNKSKELIKPITFYLDPNIPDSLKRYVKAAVSEWLPAFTASGFKGAIEIKETDKENTEWIAHSINSSLIRWDSSTNQRGVDKTLGSTAYNVIDFRSGEILKSTVVIGADIENISDAYFIRCGALDARTYTYPFPKDLIGRLIQSIVAHELGHAFGLKDGNYGEFAYPTKKIRDSTWLQKMSHTPSIMNYTRSNYVVQPWDGIPTNLLHQRVGPTDEYTIIWGYQSFNSKEEEHVTLKSMIQLQDSIPWYRFYISQYDRIGPTHSNEVSDSDDPILSCELGLQNMQRVLLLLPTVVENSNDSSLYNRIYSKTLIFWKNQMLHNSSLIGGLKLIHHTQNLGESTYKPIPLDLQRKAMDYLIRNAFEAPNWLIQPHFIDKIEHTSSSNKLVLYQIEILKDLLHPLKLNRLSYMEKTKGFEMISKELLTELNRGIWNELTPTKITISPERMELQRAYISLISSAINKEKKYTYSEANSRLYQYSEYSTSLFYSIFRELLLKIEDGLERTSDILVKGHLEYSLQQIKNALQLTKN